MLRILVSLVLIIGMACCTPFYIPTSINTPLITKGGEVNLEVSAASSGLEVYSAVGLSDNISIMINGSFKDRRTEKDDSDETERYHKHNFGEAALGFNFPLDEKWVGEFYAGGGYGSVWNSEDILFFNNRATGDIRKYFIQTDIGSKYSHTIFGLAIRGSYVKIDNLHHSFTKVKIYPEAYFIEPAIFLKFGFKVVKFKAQVLYSHILSDRKFVSHDNLISSFGVSINLFGE